MSHPATGSFRRLDGTGVPSLLARLALGSYMIYAALPKIKAPVTFLKLINEYDMVPAGWHMALNLLVVILPWVELLGGAALILGVLLRGSAALMVLMLAGFTGVIFTRTMQMVSAGEPFFQIKFDCGCGSGEQIIWQKLLLNMGLILLALWLTWSRSRRFCLSGAAARAHEPESSGVRAGSPSIH